MMWKIVKPLVLEGSKRDWSIFRLCYMNANIDGRVFIAIHPTFTERY